MSAKRRAKGMGEPGQIALIAKAMAQGPESMTLMLEGARKELDEALRRAGVPAVLIADLRGISEARAAMMPSRIARELIVVEPMPAGASAIYDRDLEVADLISPEDAEDLLRKKSDR